MSLMYHMKPSQDYGNYCLFHKQSFVLTVCMVLMCTATRCKAIFKRKELFGVRCLLPCQKICPKGECRNQLAIAVGFSLSSLIHTIAVAKISIIEAGERCD